jgi:hypothetical protein
MNPYLPLCFSVFSVFLSIIGLIISWLSYQNSNKRDLNALGTSEEQTYMMIQNAEDAQVLFNLQLAKTAQEWEALNLGQQYEYTEAEVKAIDHHIERVLNAYDIACKRYNDNKLDRQRFEATFADRLKGVCDNQEYRDILGKNSNAYSALGMVNRNFNDRELKIQKTNRNL